MSKKIPVAKRSLAVITKEISGALQSETRSIIKIGSLLLEAKKQVQHGQWLSWLQSNFDLSERSARNYMSAAEFAKSATVADLKLAPSVLYGFAYGWYSNPKVAERILEVAKTEHVDLDRANQIEEQITAKSPAERAAEKAAKKAAKAAAAAAEAKRAAEIDAKLEAQEQEAKQEIDGILDGPSELPAPEPVPLDTDKYLHERLSALILELKKLMSKSVTRFADCGIDPIDLENAADFLRQVATKIRGGSSDRVVADDTPQSVGGAP